MIVGRLGYRRAVALQLTRWASNPHREPVAMCHLALVDNVTLWDACPCE